MPRHSLDKVKKKYFFVAARILFGWLKNFFLQSEKNLSTTKTNLASRKKMFCYYIKIFFLLAPEIISVRVLIFESDLIKHLSSVKQYPH